ncbi:fimbrial protein [Winslowiella iniecta]|uniref:Fimbrial-type adhesion domain-containing protein n=1 Tax=Winslowiella iniecta TaxID=1560201 RepID=A0A0L7THM2_9GAMM|nr:fimbrial protein [Winslowiella iniecta]KOC89285.1 hypothetical protein NG42_13255 [Winslowiella iniecta]KOC94852.1 hypothetical protein NG43_03520 [Winslowiella iniecta]
MKISNFALVSLLLCAKCATAADSGFGNVNIHGVVIDAPCSISPGKDNLQLDFGQLSAAALQNGHESEPVDLDIELARCSADIQNKVRVTFKGTAFSDGLFSVAENNSSLGIAIRDHFGQQVINGQPVAWQRINDGDNVLHFTSVLKGRASPVITGPFQAQVLFYIEYN